MVHFTMLTQNQKMARAANFSKDEELYLVHLVGKYKSVIENKTSNTVTQSEKVYITIV